MSFQTLNSAIKNVIDTVSSVSESVGYPRTQFNKYPSVTITPSENESDYATTADNKRTYGFIIRVFINVDTLNVDNSKSPLSEGYRIMRDTVDGILDAFDKDERLTTGNLSLPSGYTILGCRPTPSSWGYFDEQKLLMAEIRLQVNVIFDINI